MNEIAHHHDHRHVWALDLVILTSVALVGLAVWPGGIHGSTTAAREAGAPAFLWASHSLAGILAILGVSCAERWKWRALGRVFVILAAGVLIVSAFVFGALGTRTLIGILVPAISLLIASIVIDPAETRHALTSAPRGPAT